MHRNHPVTDYRAVVDDRTQFLDVREPHELAESSIPGTINIPLGVLPERIKQLDPTRRVVVLCRSGGRSTMAAQLLTSQGFTDVVNLEGGMLAYTR
jgi:rhodanese-related sulfurtransferase